MLSFGEFQKRYSALGRKAHKAAMKYGLARHAMMRFGSTIEPVKAAFEDVIRRVIASDKSTRDPFNPTQPSKDFKIFATGPLRALWIKNPTEEVFGRIELTLAEVRRTTDTNVSLSYLSFADEARYGFETMINDPETPAKIRQVLDVAGHPYVPPMHTTRGTTARARIMVAQSGTTTCQLGVYNVADNTFDKDDVMLFEYGAKNQNPLEFERMIHWIASHADIRVVLDAGAHGYAVQAGKVAMIPSDLLPAADKTKEAVESAIRFMDAINQIGKVYILPQRKMCELKTSPADYMRILYPHSQVLDWGGGQLQDPFLSIKSTGLEQRAIL